MNNQAYCELAALQSKILASFKMDMEINAVTLTSVTIYKDVGHTIHRAETDESGRGIAIKEENNVLYVLHFNKETGPNTVYLERFDLKEWDYTITTTVLER